MLDLFTKLVFGLGIVLFTVFIIAFPFVMYDRQQEYYRCTQKNGIMMKSAYNGYVCISKNYVISVEKD